MKLTYEQLKSLRNAQLEHSKQLIEDALINDYSDDGFHYITESLRLSLAMLEIDNANYRQSIDTDLIEEWPNGLLVQGPDVAADLFDKFGLFPDPNEWYEIND